MAILDFVWLIIVFVIGLLVGMGLFFPRKKELERKLKSLEEEEERRKEELLEREKDLVRCEERAAFLEKSLREKEAVFSQAKEALRAHTLEALEETRKILLSAVEERFKEKEQTLKSFTQPLEKALSQLDQEIRRLEKEREGAYQKLDQQLKILISEFIPRLERETKHLAQALRDPGIRGRWGEIQLKRLIEWTGMLPHCDFLEQVEGEETRPDLVVRFPGDRVLAIDAKTPLSPYLEGLERRDLSSYVKTLKTHIRTLSSKEYWRRLRKDLGLSPEFVVLFLPAEALLLAALEKDPEIFEFAVKNNVILATPMSLVAILKSVALGLREEALAKNAQEIARLGRDLYERLSSFTQHLILLGQSLEKSVNQYDQLVGSFEKRVLVSARRLKDLGAGGEKELPFPAPLGRVPRKPRA